MNHVRTPVRHVTVLAIVYRKSLLGDVVDADTTLNEARWNLMELGGGLNMADFAEPVSPTINVMAPQLVTKLILPTYSPLP